MVAEISILVFWSVFFGIFSTKNLWMRGDDNLLLRMERLLNQHLPISSELLIASKQNKKTENLRKKLMLAGLHRKQDLDGAVRMRYLCGLAPLLFMFVLFFMGFPIPQILISGLLFMVVSIIIPRLIFIRMLRKRRHEIERHLPNTIDLLTLCLEAGMSFDTALIRVAGEQRRNSVQISRELLMTNQEILAGKSREESLKNLSWRAGVEEVRSLTGAIIQSLKLGTNLVQTLRTQAVAMRKKRREMIRSLILKTPVKLIFPLLFFIFPTLLIIILAPSLVDIFRHFNTLGY